ncbi:DUF3221 domain-containing protein [Acidaminobacterium chupaoyuni]
MSGRKKLWFIAAGAVTLAVLVYAFRPMTLKDLGEKPSFLGTVTEVSENSILVAVAPGEEERAASDVIRVSRKVKLREDQADFIAGDAVKVYYDGTLSESYPARAGKVYAILILSDKPV